MAKIKKIRIFSLSLLILLVSVIPAACSNVITSTITTSVFTGPPDKLEVLYFHSPTRCGSCLCFEDGITSVVNNDFSGELNSGKLTYNVYDIGESKNAELVKKYQAVGSALYLNSIKDGVDHIVNVQEIWSWNCIIDPPGFETKIKDTITDALAGKQ